MNCRAGMKPRVNVITLAVTDLDRALRFYRNGLGLQSEGIIATQFHATSAAGQGLWRCSTWTEA